MCPVFFFARSRIFDRNSLFFCSPFSMEKPWEPIPPAGSQFTNGWCGETLERISCVVSEWHFYRCSASFRGATTHYWIEGIFRADLVISDP